MRVFSFLCSSDLDISQLIRLLNGLQSFGACEVAVGGWFIVDLLGHLLVVLRLNLGLLAVEGL